MHATLTSPIAGARSTPAPIPAPTAQDTTEADRLRDLAAQALERASGDPHKAATLLENRIRANDRLQRELLERVISDQCLALVRRVAPKAPPAERAPRREIDTSARIHALADSLLDFVLPGGLKLRDATPAQLHATARVFEHNAAESRRTARWLDAVAARVPDGRKVGEALDARELQRLKDRAQA